MKKILFLIITLSFIVVLVSCDSKDEKLDCEIIESIDLIEEGYIFLFKDDCKYCIKDYECINEYYKQKRDMQIYAMNSKYLEDSIEIEGVPTLLKKENGTISIEVSGYIRVKRYISNLIKE